MFTPAFWLFNLFVLIMITLDLQINGKKKKISFKTSLLASLFWISLAIIFNLGIYYFLGKESALTFLTAYLVEESLSIDNLFVFLLIFKTMQIPAVHQHKILFWGIIGAVFFRATFILAGLALVEQFGWILYIFGAFLIYAGIKLAFEKDKEIHPEENPIVIFLERYLPITKSMEGGKFIIKGAMTPLFIALIMVETSDIIFAFDSIPAVFAITRDPFLVYTSNIFAILGLRALFFTLGGLLEKFHYLHYGLSILLVFIGIKMLIEPWVHLPISLTLGFIVSVLTLSALASLQWPSKKPSK